MDTDEVCENIESLDSESSRLEWNLQDKYGYEPYGKIKDEYGYIRPENVKAVLQEIEQKLIRIVKFVREKGIDLPTKYKKIIKYPYQYYQYHYPSQYLTELHGNGTQYPNIQSYPDTAQDYYEQKLKEFLSERLSKPTYNVEEVERQARVNAERIMMGLKPRPYIPQGEIDAGEKRLAMALSKWAEIRSKQELSEEKPQWAKAGFTSYQQWKQWLVEKREKEEKEKMKVYVTKEGVYRG